MRSVEKIGERKLGGLANYEAHSRLHLRCLCNFPRFCTNTVAQTFVVPALRRKREGRGTHCCGDASEIKGWATRQLLSVLYKRFCVGLRGTRPSQKTRRTGHPLLWRCQRSKAGPHAHSSDRRCAMPASQTLGHPCIFRFLGRTPRRSIREYSGGGAASSACV